MHTRTRGGGRNENLVWKRLKCQNPASKTSSIFREIQEKLEAQQMTYRLSFEPSSQKLSQSISEDFAIWIFTLKPFLTPRFFEVLHSLGPR